jgi:hypothetical protein
MSENVLFFKHMHSKFANCDYMTPKKCSQKNHCGVSTSAVFYPDSRLVVIGSKKSLEETYRQKSL